MQIRFLVVVLLALPFMAAAQPGMGNGMGGGHTRSIYTTGIVSGRVVDSAGNPIKGATIIFQQYDNDPGPVIAGTGKPAEPYYNEIATKKNGKFSFSRLKIYHTYVLAITVDGYKRWERRVSFNGELLGSGTGYVKDSTIDAVLISRSPEKELGDIHLQLVSH